MYFAQMQLNIARLIGRLGVAVYKGSTAFLQACGFVYSNFLGNDKTHFIQAPDFR